MAYIAPEQLEGKTIDNRADIYAVGKIIAPLFPHQYKYIARKCTRVIPADRYSSCVQVLQAIRRADRVRIWLPVSLILLLLSCAAVWGTYSGYQHSELAHKENEKQLFVHVDSLRAQNEEHRHQVDSLNRVVDSLAVKANTLSPREQVRQQAAAIHIARQAAIRKAVKRGELKTMNEVRDYDGGLQANFHETKQSIKDPMLLEEFMQAYMNYFNMNDQLYDSLALVLPEY
jgi:serine/threonine protein kinase